MGVEESIKRHFHSKLTQCPRKARAPTAFLNLAQSASEALEDAGFIPKSLLWIQTSERPGCPFSHLQTGLLPFPLPSLGLSHPPGTP